MFFFNLFFFQHLEIVRMQPKACKKSKKAISTLFFSHIEISGSHFHVVIESLMKCVRVSFLLFAYDIIGLDMYSICKSIVVWHVRGQYYV